MTRRYKAGKRRRGRKARRGLNVVLSVFIVAVVVTAVLALTNSILGVNSPRLGENTSGINPAALQPQECRDAGLSPTSIVTGNNGTNASDLILGTNARQTIRGRGGDDCIVGGGGNDRLRGDAGTDVCIGGPGNDTFNRCEYQYQ